MCVFWFSLAFSLSLSFHFFLLYHLFCVCIKICSLFWYSVLKKRVLMSSHSIVHSLWLQIFFLLLRHMETAWVFFFSSFKHHLKDREITEKICSFDSLINWRKNATLSVTAHVFFSLLFCSKWIFIHSYKQPDNIMQCDYWIIRSISFTLPLIHTHIAHSAINIRFYFELQRIIRIWMIFSWFM